MSSSNHNPPTPRLLRLPEVIARVGLGRASLYKRIQDGTFPSQIRLGLGARAVAWNSQQVDAWIAEQIAASLTAQVKS